ncbi:hypothetical protein [Mycobacterium sp.]|uniref:hypothetical protein n=1 Tax=Mycobacterium sp. TaxID=1785 RepID=UPI0025DD30BC|nr:hypothetical protein [Mycobacterium sp.]
MLRSLTSAVWITFVPHQWLDVPIVLQAADACDADSGAAPSTCQHLPARACTSDWRKRLFEQQETLANRPVLNPNDYCRHRISAVYALQLR